MTSTICARNLSRRYRGQLALDEVSLDVAPQTITGLLGRNGAGKSTLMRIIAAQEFASSGTIHVFGEDPTENDAVLRRMVFVREDQVYPDYKVAQLVEAASWFFPNWNDELAQSLLDDFELPRTRSIKKLSRGMRSAVGIVIGLAARAELTMLDEPYAGLDAVSRQLFYDRLLADYVEHPRTLLLSTHLIDEVADLLEHVVLIDHGRIALDAAAEDVRGRAATVSGPSGAVDEFVFGRQILHRRAMLSRASVVITGVLDESDRRRAQEMHLNLEPLSLQELMVHTSEAVLAERKKRVNNLIKVARYHLVNRVGFVLVPWGVMTFAFLVCLIIFWRIAPSPHASHVGAVASMFVVFCVLGVQSVAQSLPFGLSLGVSRRTYFAGTVLLVVVLSAAYGLLLAVLQEVERATGGWGVDMHFFRVSYLLNGPWYQTWLTSFVGLALLFVCGMWFGLVWRRWNIVGLVLFIASLVTTLLIAALAITWAHVWDGVGHFFTVLSSTGLTGVLAALAVVLAAGGLATMRRVTV